MCDRRQRDRLGTYGIACRSLAAELKSKGRMRQIWWRERWGEWNLGGAGLAGNVLLDGELGHDEASFLGVLHVGHLGRLLGLGRGRHPVTRDRERGRKGRRKGGLRLWGTEGRHPGLVPSEGGAGLEPI